LKLLKNISYTFSSNILNVLVSILVILVIPKFIGVYEYGLWQLFIFYFGYVGVLHLGWADGLFLRRGGQKVEDINIGSIMAETILFISYNIILGLSIYIYGLCFSTGDSFIIETLGIAVIVANIRTWITMILQSVGDFKGYAVNLSVQSIVYLALIIVILLLGLADYRFMIIAFLISQFGTCISGFLQLKEIFDFNEPYDFKDAFKEAKLNINSGFKLMIANFTAILIVGVIRFGIQQRWSVSTFGKVSLVLSIANLIMVFINAVSLVLFPTLRRTNQNITELYEGTRNVLMPMLYVIMFAYFPIKLLIPMWLPKYSDALQYAAVLMPMMVYQGKFEILSNTFMKNLRMEFKLLIINVITLLASIFLTILNVYIFHDLNSAVFSIAIVMGMRSVVSELIISRRIKITFWKELIFENLFIIAFMIVSWNYSLIMSVLGYLIVVLIYLVIKKDSIKLGITVLKKLSNF